MKFTKSELTEMRKLAGIEHTMVDFRRREDMLSEARESVAKVEEPVVTEPETVEEGLPTHHMPGKSIKKVGIRSKGKRIKLSALLARHKHPAVAGKP